MAMLRMKGIHAADEARDGDEGHVSDGEKNAEVKLLVKTKMGVSMWLQSPELVVYGEYRIQTVKLEHLMFVCMKQ